MTTSCTNNDFARVRWQCRRGMLELDLLFDAFLIRDYSTLDSAQRAVFADILQFNDQDLFEYFFRQRQHHDKDVAHVIERIRCAAAP